MNGALHRICVRIAVLQPSLNKEDVRCGPRGDPPGWRVVELYVGGILAFKVHAALGLLSARTCAPVVSCHHWMTGGV